MGGVFAPPRVCSEGSHTQGHADKPEGHTRRGGGDEEGLLSCTDREGCVKCGNISFSGLWGLCQQGKGGKQIHGEQTWQVNVNKGNNQK